MTQTQAQPPPSEDFERTRRSLLTRLKNWDDKKGWKEFMDRYGKFIFSIGMRSGLSREEAEDVVQDTVVSVAKKIPDFRYQGDKGSFKAWLLMIIKSRIVDLLRKKYRRLPDSGAYMPDDPTGTSVEARIAQKEDELSHSTIWQSEWEKHVLDSALNCVKDRVTPKHFLAFRMCTQQGKSAGEVSKALGIPLPMIYVIRHRVGRQVAAEVKRLTEGQ
ncbi:MAG TPA: sigma-70 family RNA polymerase sigma factor [Verrucomicrobiales bacterium]|nr:sigma-70 family RNA polymerase sigma factor [Verrucomicrobiales bacterium]